MKRLQRLWYLILVLADASLAGKAKQVEEDEMPAMNGNVRDHVLREMRIEIRDLAAEGMSAEEIDRQLNGHRTLTQAEQGMIELLTYHAAAEARGQY
jgi:hypothetical protein